MTNNIVSNECNHDWALAGIDIYKCRKCGKVIDMLEDADGY